MWPKHIPLNPPQSTAYRVGSCGQWAPQGGQPQCQGDLGRLLGASILWALGTCPAPGVWERAQGVPQLLSRPAGHSAFQNIYLSTPGLSHGSHRGFLPAHRRCSPEAGLHRHLLGSWSASCCKPSFHAPLNTICNLCFAPTSRHTIPSLQRPVLTVPTSCIQHQPHVKALRAPWALLGLSLRVWCRHCISRLAAASPFGGLSYSWQPCEIVTVVIPFHR